MKIEKLNDIEKAAFYTQVWYSMATNMGEDVIMKYPVAELNLKNGLEKGTIFAEKQESKVFFTKGNEKHEQLQNFFIHADEYQIKFNEFFEELHNSLMDDDEDYNEIYSTIQYTYMDGHIDY